MSWDNSSATLKHKSSSKRKSKTEFLNSKVNQQENASVGKSASCIELPSSFLKTNTHSNLESSSMFFNEKGWPVKVMRLTDTSLPKANKPIPTRSLPSTSCNTNSNTRKEKSLYTQKKVLPPKFSREDKENSSKCIQEKYQPTKEQCSNPSEHIPKVQSDVVSGLDSDIQAVLDHLDNTVNKFSSEEVIDSDHGKQMQEKTLKVKKSVQKLPDKKPSRLEKSEHLTSPRSNKYNSREMKAYIQAKRSERKQHLSEEAKKKQAMMEQQKKNLEQLREKASKVLKKSSAKTVEESKPRWQGPLEEDNSETSALAIHIFETKVPTAKKPKLSAKSEASEQCNQNPGIHDIANELADKEDKEDSNNSKLEYEENPLPSKVVNNNINMEERNPYENRDAKVSTKLRLSRNKISIDDPKILSAVGQAVTEHNPQLKKDFGGVRDSIDQLTQPTTKCVNGWTHNQLAPVESNSILISRNDDRRKTFNISQSAEELILPSESCLNKRHRISNLKTDDDMISKKMRATDSPQLSHDNPLHGESIEDALKKFQQQILSNQKEGKNREWFHTSIKPDAFSIMNVIKMKRLSCKKYDNYGLEKKERFRDKVISERPSVEDETDAPPIVSMEEDFKIIPEPLRLSDMCLPTVVSGSTVDWTPRSSVNNSHANKKVINNSMKTSTSSFASEAPPLVVPESVQHLKLRTRRTPDELSSSLSLELQSQYTISDWPTSDRAHDLSTGVPPIQLSSRVIPEKLPSQQQYNEGDTQQPEPASMSNCGQIEIGQVMTSPISSRSMLSSRIQSVSERPLFSDSASESSRHTSLKSVEELCSNQEISFEKRKEVFQMQRSVMNSQASTSPSTLSHKNLQLFKVLIEDALFQKEQYDLMYKTQEDVLQANYKAALAELDLKVRNVPSSLDSESPEKEVDVRNKIESFYRRARGSIRRTKNHVISNWIKRIDDLQKEKDQLEKQMKSKRFKLRSAEASPKKLITLRSSSATSIVENSSSSEASVSTQHFDDKKRHENDKGLVLKQKRAEKEILKKLYDEEKQKVQEIAKVERSLKSGRSRRDKSTSPLQSVQEASTRDVACSVQEDIQNISHQLTSSSLQSVETRGTDVYNSESFESPESSETPRQPRLINRPFVASKPFIATRLNSKSKMLIKVPLSPRMQLCTRRRGSSGSDESLLLSQNETQSEQSDYEVKISALKEQKRQRLMILNRLHRELKKAQKELLKATEASLIKQIQVYDSYIDQTKKQLAEVTEEVSAKKVVRPQIKHPRVSDKFLPRTSDILQKSLTVEVIDDNKQQEIVLSDIETNSIKTVSEVSSTETTIQSSGPAQVKEQLSSEEILSKEEINSEENANTELCSPQQSETRISEVPSCLATEASNIPSVEVSNGSVTSEITEDHSKSALSSTTNTESVDDDENQWVDAEEFLGQLDNLEKLSSESLQCSKVNLRNLSTSQTTNESQVLTSIENLLHQEKPISKESEQISEVSDPVLEENLIPDGSTNEQTIDEELSSIKSTKESVSDHLDIGNIVSIISQAPSPRKVKYLESEILHVDSDPTSTIFNTESDPKSNLEVLSGSNDNDQTASICDSEKSNIPETALLNNSLSLDASISSDINTTSQKSTPCISDSEDIDPSESGIIKVFVSNKTQVIDEHVVADSKNEQLDRTFIISNDDENIIKDVNEEMVDKITDYVFNNLLSECVKDDVRKNETENKSTNSEYNVSTDKNLNSTLNENSVNSFTKTILNKFFKDATDCMLKVNESKKFVQLNLSNVSNKIEETSSPNKLLDALALESNSVPLYTGHIDDSVEPENKLENSPSTEVEIADGNDGEVFWFDEDVHHPVSLQAQREAEELRIKQLQIEREIKQLEQAQENIPSYYYVREIPNKPPPPYTPPQPQPTRQEDIENLAAIATQSLVGAWKRGDDLTSIQPSEQYYSKRVGSQVFKKFMFDLVKQIFIDTTSSDGNGRENPSWEKTVCRLKHLVLPEVTEDSVNRFILKKVRVLFGFEPSYIKENLIIQWSRKKRDRVDELLVRESQEEEQEWTDYSRYEVAVKNSVALNIFDSLIEETTIAISDAFKQKLSYFQQHS